MASSAGQLAGAAGSDKAGALEFSSSWSGSKTVEQVLGGGNLVVH